MKSTNTTAREITLLTRQTASLLGAGLPLVQALDLLGRTSRRGALAQVAHDLARRVSSGERFAEALAAHPAQFNPLYRALSAIGEASGTLALVLTRLAEHRERAAAQRAKLRTALAYPCAVLLLAAAVTAALLAFVVPTFEHIFAGFGAALPAPTRTVLALSSAVRRWGPLGLAVCGAAALVAARLVRRLPSVRMARDRWLLAMPAVGPLSRALAAARWSHSLGTLLTAGMPLAEALQALSHVTGNAVFDAANRHIETRLRRGERFAQAVRGVGCFPASLVELLTVAEETSMLDTVLLDCAALAERQVDETLALASACAEPLVVIVLGLAVGALVTALYLPVIELGNVV